MHRPNYLYFQLVAGFILFMSHALTASPLVSIGESAKIHFIGQSSFEYDSNIFSDNSDKTADLIYTLSPGFQFVTGQNADFSSRVTLQQETRLFADNSDLRQFNEIVKLHADYDGGGKFSVSVNGGYRTRGQNTNTANIEAALIRRRNYNLGFDASYDFSPKTQLSLMPGWRHTDYRNFIDTFSDRHIYTIPVDLFYRYSPKLKIGMRYRYRHTNFDVARGLSSDDIRDRNDHFVGFRSVGQITSKLRNNTSIGWQYQNLSGGDSFNSLTLRSELTWQATQKFRLTAGINRDVNASGAGVSIQQTGGHLRANYALSQKVSTHVQTRFTVSDYENAAREDELFTAAWGLKYKINDYLRFNARYRYLNNDGNIENAINPDISSFNRHLVEFSTRLRY